MEEFICPSCEREMTRCDSKDRVRTEIETLLIKDIKDAFSISERSEALQNYLLYKENIIE